jgi:hypothetical protein
MNYTGPCEDPYLYRHHFQVSQNGDPTRDSYQWIVDPNHHTSDSQIRYTTRVTTNQKKNQVKEKEKPIDWYRPFSK